MTKKEKKTLAASIVARLREVYPTAECALEYGGDPWRLLVMGRLSAQCTDERVNIVCRELFRRFPDARAMAEGPLSEIESIVKPCGLYKMKAKNIMDSSRILIDEYGGELPRDMDELLRFPGVGRKIANLLIGDIFGMPAIVADTHCIRISARLGLYPESEKRPEQVERILRELIPPEEGADYCHRIVFFGREWCTARSPRCECCPLSDLCAKRKREG